MSRTRWPLAILAMIALLSANLAINVWMHSGTKPGRDETWSQPSAITFSRCQPINTSACQLISTPRTESETLGGVRTKL